MMMTNSRALETALRSRLSESLCNKSVNVVPQIYLHCAMPTAIFSYAEERFPRALFSLSELNANIKGIFFLSIVVVFVLFFFFSIFVFSLLKLGGSMSSLLLLCIYLIVKREERKTQCTFQHSVRT